MQHFKLTHIQFFITARPLSKRCRAWYRYIVL